MPLKAILKETAPLASGGNRPLKMTFEDQLNALISFHLEDHISGRHLIQTLTEDDFAREKIAPARIRYMQELNRTMLVYPDR